MHLVKFIHPQIEPGKTYMRGEMHKCFIRIREIPLTYDVHSADENDRAEYWEVNISDYDSQLLPALMTESEVETAVYGVNGKAAYFASLPAPSFI